MTKKINIGCNILIIKNKKILLGKRKNCFGEGTWGLPGGHLKYGEDLEAAAIRELKEELGIKAQNLKLISVVEGEKVTDHYIQINFLLDNFKGKVKLMEPEFCEAWEYFSLDQLPEVFLPHQNIIKSFVQKHFYLR